ncbi:hypothetical protein Anas_06679 [Armadillidium nasatum]|uniref:Gamma-interferon-inducible lysosomal thiol reductase n=1 Tax=Armadillidium nasatum TaxID=96803 RepID=A0A5N5SJ16_9CRUS|nr:hypothetical protein Anas_06679 [Armadillidium nasatum]
MMKKKTPSFSGKECIEQEGEEWKPVDSCAEGEMGSGLMLENRRKTQSLSPRITSIPTVTVNGVNNFTFNEWAMHDLTALVCDAFILSAEEEGKITLPKGCPVRIELYIEMLCPDTKRFFLKQFYPAWKNLQSLIDLHLIPFGKANMIICMLESSSPSDAGKQCAEKLKLAWEPLEKCYTSEEGSEFLFQNGIRTMSLKPSFYFVPTVTVNKYYDSEQLQKNLSPIVCEAYQEPYKRGSKVLTPKGCKLQIDLYFIGHSKESKDFFLNQLLTTWKKLNKFLTLNLFPIGTIINKSRNEISFEESCRKRRNLFFRFDLELRDQIFLPLKIN